MKKIAKAKKKGYSKTRFLEEREKSSSTSSFFRSCRWPPLRQAQTNRKYTWLVFGSGVESGRKNDEEEKKRRVVEKILADRLASFLGVFSYNLSAGVKRSKKVF